jgi:O-antigen ligase
MTATGHGTGWDTNSALRYGDATERRFVENWYAKATLELGVVGVISIIVAFAALGARLAVPLRRCDARARPLAAGVFALLAITAVSLFKGPYIDLDPLNVYFWLFAGMLLGLYRAADRDASERDVEVAA